MKQFIGFSLLVLGLIVVLAVSACKSKKALKTSAFDLSEYLVESDQIRAACGNKAVYAPDAEYPEHTPTRYVRVNCHFLYDERGELGLRKRDTEPFVRELLRRANGYLNQNMKMRLPLNNDTPVLPVRYQYVLTGDPDVPGDIGIYHHTHPTLCYFKYDTPTRRNTHFKPDVFDEFGVQKGEVLNIFFLEHHPDSIGAKGYKTPKGIGGSKWVKMAAVNQQYKKKWINEPTGTGSLGEFSSRLLNHEIGHSLGLNHTWNSNDGCDDTPKNPNCWAPGHPKSCTEEMSSNNVMDYNKWSQAFTPCQLAKVHYNFSKLSATQRRILRPDWCTYDKKASIDIKSDIVWEGSKDIAGDIVIKNGGQLTLNCRLSLSEGAKIIVYPKGRLVVDGGAITNTCEGNWGGIEIKDDGNVSGQVDFYNKAMVANVAL